MKQRYRLLLPFSYLSFFLHCILHLFILHPLLQFFSFYTYSLLFSSCAKNLSDILNKLLLFSPHHSLSFLHCAIHFSSFPFLPIVPNGARKFWSLPNNSFLLRFSLLSSLPLLSIRSLRFILYGHVLRYTSQITTSLFTFFSLYPVLSLPSFPFFSFPLLSFSIHSFPFLSRHFRSIHFLNFPLFGA